MESGMEYRISYCACKLQKGQSKKFTFAFIEVLSLHGDYVGRLIVITD